MILRSCRPQELRQVFKQSPMRNSTFFTVLDTSWFGVFVYNFDDVSVTRNTPNLTLACINYPMIKLVSICIVLLKITVFKNLLIMLSEDLLYSGHGGKSVIEKERSFHFFGLSFSQKSQQPPSEAGY